MECIDRREVKKNTHRSSNRNHGCPSSREREREKKQKNYAYLNCNCQAIIMARALM